MTSMLPPRLCISLHEFPYLPQIDKDVCKFRFEDASDKRTAPYLLFMDICRYKAEINEHLGG